MPLFTFRLARAGRRSNAILGTSRLVFRGKAPMAPEMLRT